jgi:hypothetical protein
VERRGRPKRYGQEITAALKVDWDPTERLCSKRLQPFLPELVKVLQNWGGLRLKPEVVKSACGGCHLSASTIDRLLKLYRHSVQSRSCSSTNKPGSLLKAAIPIRTPIPSALTGKRTVPTFREGAGGRPFGKLRAGSGGPLRGEYRGNLSHLSAAHAHPRVAAKLAGPVASPLPPRTAVVRVQRTVHPLKQ